jgi:hypothetical protein
MPYNGHGPSYFWSSVSCVGGCSLLGHVEGQETFSISSFSISSTRGGVGVGSAISLERGQLYAPFNKLTNSTDLS